MSEAPSPTNKKTIYRVQIVVIAIALVGIVLFVGFWLFLGEAGMDDFPRLIASFCIPPAIIALAMGIYMVLTYPKRNDSD